MQLLFAKSFSQSPKINICSKFVWFFSSFRTLQSHTLLRSCRYLCFLVKAGVLRYNEVYIWDVTCARARNPVKSSAKWQRLALLDGLTDRESLCEIRHVYSVLRVHPLHPCSMAQTALHTAQCAGRGCFSACVARKEDARAGRRSAASAATTPRCCRAQHFDR